MGIPRFFEGWLRNHSKINSIIYKLPEDISSLYIDMNSIIHNVTQKVYSYGTYDDLDKQNNIIALSRNENFEGYIMIEIEKELKFEMKRILATLHPKDLLYVAVDGVAPQAKISQQRFRRFGEKKNDDDISTESMFKIYDNYDTNFGPGGTIFDSNCITPGTEFMFKLDNIIKRVLQETKVTRHILYSSHMEEGEGEHKIMAFLRSKESKDYIPLDGNHVVLGLDTDLVILTALSSIKNLYLYRENTKTGRADILRMSTFRQNIVDMGITIEDFSIIVSMYGSDFLPHQEIIEDPKTIDIFISILSKLKIRLCDSEHNLIKENFLEFIKSIYANEDSLYITLYNHLRNDRFSMPNHILNKNIIERGRTLTFNKGGYRNDFYNKVFGIKAEVNQNDIWNFIKEYLNGIQWINYYYNYGHYKVNNGWYYGYYYAPMFVDIFLYLSKFDLPTDFKQIDDYPSVYQQLLSVLPYKSKNLAPLELQMYMTKDGPIADLYPDVYFLDMNGKAKTYTGVKYIPFADYKRIKNLVQEMPYNNKYNRSQLILL